MLDAGRFAFGNDKIPCLSLCFVLSFNVSLDKYILVGNQPNDLRIE